MAWLLDNTGELRFVDLESHRALTDKLAQMRGQLIDSNGRPASPVLLGELSDILLKPLMAAGLAAK